MERLLGLPPRERACGAARPYVFPRRSCLCRVWGKVRIQSRNIEVKQALNPVALEFLNAARYSTQHRNTRTRNRLIGAARLLWL